MFIIKLNNTGINNDRQTTTTGFSGFELKASINNFDGSYSNNWTNNMVFWCISEPSSGYYNEYPDKPTTARAMMKFVNDPINGSINTNNGRFDSRSRRYFDSYNELSNQFPEYVIVIIDPDEINKVSPAAWLSPDNEDIVWSFLRFSMNGDYEKD
jgi:hypothetical protein